MIKQILSKIFGNEASEFPAEFAIVDYSPEAKRKNIKDDQNKVIYRYYIDEFGYRAVKSYRFSKSQLSAIQETYKLPVLDKTQKEDKFPVYSDVSPSEIEYEKDN